MRRPFALSLWAIFSLFLVAAPLRARDRPSAELRLRIVSSLRGKPHPVPAVIWLAPARGTTVAPFLPHGHYTLLQKNRTFLPHLQVIPVGGVVAFPNEDPFFHNVFSLFEGKRFNLGLYESGSSKSVAFSRAGVSYIFCNIHPEMSAVIIALSTPLYSVADAQDAFTLRRIPPGEYRLHVWIEGVPQSFLESLTRSVRIASVPRIAGPIDLGTIQAPIAGAPPHSNLYGKPYPQESQSPYSDLP